MGGKPIQTDPAKEGWKEVVGIRRDLGIQTGFAEVKRAEERDKNCILNGVI